MVRLCTWTVCAALLAGTVVWADRYAQFPGPTIDGSTLRFKEKVEDIYASGNHERALLIYQKELAPRGDKYAQYMTGYMHLHGQGVVADPAAALAWYRLAAERGEPKFIAAHDTLASSLDEAERARADELFAALWKQHGDRRIVLDLIEEDLAILRHSAVGRRDGAGAGLASGYAGQAANPYHQRVRSDLEARLAWLDAAPPVPEQVDGAELLAREVELRREAKALRLP